MSESIKDLQDLVIKYRNQRDWKKFHNPKDLSLSLTLEAAELLELFQWKDTEEMGSFVKNHKNKIEEEIADVFYCVLLFSGDLDIDLVKVFKRKMRENKKKYPVKKSKGSNKKYTEL